jgi:Protein of unknown function (DUF1203)
MNSYRVIAIPDKVSHKVRTILKAPGYGHPAHVEVAAGYGPCRACLQKFREGEEERVLFTYDPFHGLDSYPSPGPVFIHREECSRFDGEGFPPELRDLPLTLEAYGPERWIVARERVTDGEVDAAIGRLLARDEVGYLHVRNTEAGCYIARVERAG